MTYSISDYININDYIDDDAMYEQLDNDIELLNEIESIEQDILDLLDE